ncbi:hypothetical protein lerEdw1_020741 [Lerista edwardsae]|nr:hypothetical protein lerEdw1_020741 [Lerista edwardsae]
MQKKRAETCWSEKKEAFENPVAFPPELTCRIGEFYDAKSLLETVMNQFPAFIKRGTQSEKKEAFQNPVAFPPELTCRIVEFYDAKPLLERVMQQFPACPRLRDFYRVQMKESAVTAASLAPCQEMGEKQLHGLSGRKDILARNQSAGCSAESGESLPQILPSHCCAVSTSVFRVRRFFELAQLDLSAPQAPLD